MVVWVSTEELESRGCPNINGCRCDGCCCGFGIVILVVGGCGYG